MTYYSDATPVSYMSDGLAYPGEDYARPWARTRPMP